MRTRRRFADSQFAAGLFTFLFISIAGVGEGDMNPKVVQQRGFTVVGIAARTSNAREATADGVIGKQWGRFMQEGLLAKIPNKTDSAVVAVYTDYASDANGEYTYLLGARVKADRVNLGHDVPAGMVAKKIPAGRYAVFTSDKGPAPKVVPATWKRIWETPKSEPGGDRAYGADFEVYDQRAADPENAQVDVYVGIR
jgi:predicted transcriptional regulator YdeE